MTVTYEIENVMWPRMIVGVESSMPTRPKNSSRPTAVTISGVIRGSSMRMLAEPPRRPRARTSPNASNVPRIVATTIVTAAIWKLTISEFLISGSFQASRYQRKLSPSKTCSELPELNE